MPNSLYPAWPWLVDFSDLTYAPVKKFGNAYLVANPDPTKNYYYNTATALISFANSKGVPVEMMNAVIPPHYIVTNWQIAYLQDQVCLNNIGLSNVDIKDDMFAKAQHIFHAEMIQLQNQITYELFQTASMQQSYTRNQGARNFPIFY
jgi:hypothetical protein